MSTFAVPSFNPLQFANRLKAAGVPEKQAEAEAEVLHEVLAQQTQAVSALENQVKTLSSEAKRDAEQMATKGDLFAVREDVLKLDAKIELVRRDLVIKLGGMLIAGFGIVIGLLFKLVG